MYAASGFAPCREWDKEDRSMLYTKACPRCHGDIKLDRDSFGVFAKCLQCGFNRDFVTKRQHVAPVVAEDMAAPAGAETLREAA